MSREGGLYFDEEWASYDPAAAQAALEAEGQALRWKQANGRAATKSRRYFVRNGLRYMWVLTFATAEFDRRRVMREVSEFARRLREVFGLGAFAYWYSPELHPGGHGWHVNFFIPTFQDHAPMAKAWGLGFVFVVDYATARRSARGEPLGLCRSPREACRRAAQYGCKYSQKDWSAEHVGTSNHRYEVAQGFAPIKVSRWVTGRAEADDIVRSLLSQDGSPALTIWDSIDAEEWARPPVRTYRW